jgi:hypothetical protein
MFNGNYDEYFFYDESNPGEEEYDKINDIRGVLDKYGFTRYPVDTSKIPCVVIANLVTPRRDPHGYDKSSIDISPFADSIIQIVKKLGQDIKSYRARGLYFKKPDERKTAVDNSGGKGALGKMLIQYLQEHRGLPAIKADGSKVGSDAYTDYDDPDD